MPSDQPTHETSPQAVLWDLDGTLVDTEELWFEAEVVVMARHGYEWTLDDQQHSLGGPLERVTVYMATLVHDGAGADAIAAELTEQMEHLLITRDPQWRPGVVELIREIRLADMAMGLVTASHRRLVDALDDTLEHALAAAAGIKPPVFDVVIAGDEVAQTKPSPQPYLAAAEALGVPMRACVIIEDSPTGVAAGRASGAFVVAVPHISIVDVGSRGVVVETLAGVGAADLVSWWRRPASTNDPSARPEQGSAV
jgi:beta-phosphoglucomutase-like phosphatase (HAD superfamily)